MRFIKYYVFILIILLCCMFLTGCSKFIADTNLKGKNIIYKNERYYIREDGKLLRFWIKKDNRIFPISTFAQNKDKSLTALIVVSLKQKDFYLPFIKRKIKTNPKYVLLISGKDVIYQKESFAYMNIRWIDEENLQIDSPYEKIIVNKKGKVIKKEKRHEKELKFFP